MKHTICQGAMPCAPTTVVYLPENGCKQAIQQQLMTKSPMSKSMAFHQALLDSGLVKQIKQPNYRS